eukprot:CAMPEP_0177586320 /NCGR_PEP_ID=MMETSP0419_2-20121207/5006_1 /TAXON_ID=582737 /ORGANISM="Tetraselmis sp., Strain GSL018" /LENGTH=1454 /DNA_ID=CAMNT_0019076197 /DNA_START=342 /DNA_END=4706 /DNA_ORIENTATION=+
MQSRGDAVTESHKSNPVVSANTAKVPAPKLIPGCGFVVDGFKHAGAPGIRAFFLSHAHADHYTGITDRWEAGPIYCSEVTGRLVRHLLGVEERFIAPLPIGAPQTIQGVEVTLVDANHCPGAVQFLFRLPDGRRYVHCGDMRFSKAMKEDPEIRKFQGCDAVFLDTTYCNPKHTFPSQGESVEFVAAAVEAYLREEAGGGPSCLFVVSTYTIGKERILAAVARRCGLKFECSRRKMGTLRCLGMGDGELEELFTAEEGSSRLLLASWGSLGETWPFFRPNWTRLESLRLERGVDKAVGFVPTGWTFKAKASEFPVHAKDNLVIHLVPYSEHSSFDELQEYVGFLRPKQVIPTVGVGGDSGEKNRLKMLRHFRNLVDSQSSKAEFLRSMRRPPPRPDSEPEAEQAGGQDGASQAEPEPKGEEDEVDEPSAAKREEGPNEDEAPPGPRREDGRAEDGKAKGPRRDEGPVGEEATAGPKGEDRSVREAPPLTPRPLGGGPVAKEASGLGQGEARSAAGSGGRGTARVPPTAEAPRTPRRGGAVPPGTRHSEDAGAAKLLEIAEGDLARAINMHYDARPSPGGGLGAKRPAARSPMPPGAPSAGKRRRGASSSQASITSFISRGAAARSPEHRPPSAAVGASTAGLPSLPEEDADAGAPDADGEGLEPGPACRSPIPLLTPAEAESPPGRPAREKGRAGEPARGPDCLEITRGSAAGGLPPSPAALPPAADERLSAELSARESATLGADLAADPLGLVVDRFACWEEGQAAPFLHLSRTFATAFATTKRIATRDAFTNCFRAVLRLSPCDLLAAAYLACGKLAPDHENVELSVGGSTVAAAVVEATGTTRQRLRELYRDLGDLGDVAQSCRRNQVMLARPAPLTIRGVYSTLRKIALEKGSGSGARRQGLVLSLLRSAREEETRFIVRMLVQNLRVGANWRSVIGALGRAAALHHAKDGLPTKKQLEIAEAATVEAFHLCPSLDVLVPVLLETGPSELGSVCTLRPGVPVKPMLAKAAEGITDALSAMGTTGGAVLGEYKYDGQRAQIHVTNERKVSIFSRNGENRTDSFPDVAEVILEASVGGATSFIVDAELVAIDRANGNRLKAFQELSTRARGAVTSAEITVEVAIFVFDILIADGQPVIEKTLRERRKILQQALPLLAPGRIELARCLEVNTQAKANISVGQIPAIDNRASVQPKDETAEAVLQEFLLTSFADGAEGLMLKQLDAGGYQPSKRSESWLKVKRDYCEGLRDSLDLVPIGGWHGNGRKAKWLSPFLLAAWDPVNEEFQSVCRVMSGFTDQFYAEATERLGRRHRIDGPKPYYVTGECCSVWFEPAEVWEIRGADLTISPVHKAARGHLHPEKGVSMRFPRFIRVRDDKRPQDASTPEVIVDLFNRQTRKVDTRGAPAAQALGNLNSSSGAAQEDLVEDGAEDDGESAFEDDSDSEPGDEACGQET